MVQGRRRGGGSGGPDRWRRREAEARATATVSRSVKPAARSRWRGASLGFVGPQLSVRETAHARGHPPPPRRLDDHHAGPGVRVEAGGSAALRRRASGSSGRVAGVAPSEDQHACDATLPQPATRGRALHGLDCREVGQRAVAHCLRYRYGIQHAGILHGFACLVAAPALGTRRVQGEGPRQGSLRELLDPRPELHVAQEDPRVPLRRGAAQCAGVHVGLLRGAR
mmetsp:Transcript_33400/g.84591  ORF Transcript_33400/g.84591 Transcript_33400/m.84591 type:complete len:225 (+) Transcript_33400:3-677(+)